MKQFLVCWDYDDDVWVFNGEKWRFRGTSGKWVYSKTQDWLPTEFTHVLKVNNFKEK